jgi:hypothetical protein
MRRAPGRAAPGQSGGRKSSSIARAAKSARSAQPRRAAAAKIQRRGASPPIIDPAASPGEASSPAPSAHPPGPPAAAAEARLRTTRVRLRRGSFRAVSICFSIALRSRRESSLACIVQHIWLTNQSKAPDGAAVVGQFRSTGWQRRFGGPNCLASRDRGGRHNRGIRCVR